MADPILVSSLERMSFRSALIYTDALSMPFLDANSEDVPLEEMLRRAEFRSFHPIDIRSAGIFGMIREQVALHYKTLPGNYTFGVEDSKSRIKLWGRDVPFAAMKVAEQLVHHRYIAVIETDGRDIYELH